jgi:hypothetical protein
LADLSSRFSSIQVMCDGLECHELSLSLNRTTQCLPETPFQRDSSLSTSFCGGDVSKTLRKEWQEQTIGGHQLRPRGGKRGAVSIARVVDHLDGFSRQFD